MTEYDFRERLEMSMKTLQIERDEEILKTYFPDVESVEKTPPELDKKGIDYIVKLKSGVCVNIDAKTREKGCSRFWKNGMPELSLEWWSEKWPNGERKNKPGWTFDTRKQFHYVMFKFDPSDTDSVYVLPFQQLNKAFRKNGIAWRNKYGLKEQPQKTAGYISSCVIVPADVVCEAVREVFTA